MIIEISFENSIIRWKNNNKNKWKDAEISDLITAYEGMRGKWIITKDEKFYHYKCPFCGFWATGDFLSTNSNLDLPNFCEKCGADMRGKEE